MNHRENQYALQHQLVPSDSLYLVYLKTEFFTIRFTTPEVHQRKKDSSGPSLRNNNLQPLDLQEQSASLS
uniref:Uncharacterized protein n=1 Tax=Arundo donax TaxID=35708 RepID=A0A0A8Y9V8_ARUDO